jgi:hypothetical protein
MRIQSLVEYTNKNGEIREKVLDGISDGCKRFDKSNLTKIDADFYALPSDADLSSQAKVLKK